jgi:DNA replication and repair protein RecF
MNDQPVRQFASQGQHRTFGLALKLAQRAYTETKTEQVPLLLLDDAFDSLDPERTEAFITYLTAASAGQTIATTAHPRGFERLFPDPDGRHQNIHLHWDGPEGELAAIQT